MIFNPGLFQAPDFFRLYGDGVEENGSACLAPIGPGQNTILHHSLQSYAIPYHLTQSYINYSNKHKKKEEHLAPPICNNCSYDYSKSKAKYKYISYHPLATSNP